MKKAVLCVLLAMAVLPLGPQEIRHATGVINVEVPVRVFSGETFIDNLALNDFEVRENGIPQKVVAVYLVKRTDILRKEEQQTIAPNTHRTFYLFFEIYEYLPKLREALTYFIKNVLSPQDDLAVVTSLKTYHLKKDLTARLTREQLVEQLAGLVRKDTVAGNTEYNSALDDLKGIARRLTSAMVGGGMVGGGAGANGLSSSFFENSAGDFDEIVDLYRAALQKLENLRRVDDKKLVNFARYLKNVEGQKNVFVFYQREFIPVLDKKVLNLNFSMLEPSTQMNLTELFSFQKRQPTLDADAVKKAYADSSIAIHFLYVTSLPDRVEGLQMEEHSEDILAPFLEMSQATGGIAESSANPAFAMKKAADASENYYLLYYAPSDTQADGKFREIKVSVKGKTYRVSHRAGYFAS
jgi:VWFA-related protein